MRHYDLRTTPASRGRRCAGAAMVDHRGDSRKERLLVDFADDEAVLALIDQRKLRRYTGDGQGGFEVEALIDVRFVPLLDGVAKEL